MTGSRSSGGRPWNGRMPDGNAWPDLLFWLGQRAREGERVSLDPVESRHVLRVLRRRPGDSLTLADGAGGWLEGRIVGASAGIAEVEILSRRRSIAEPAGRVHLGFPTLRSGRTEYLLEKCTELGVTRFTPVRTARGRSCGGRLDRWRRVVTSASLQSLRSTPPELMAEVSLTDWLSGMSPSGARLVARPGGASELAGSLEDVVGLVGPEGDLTGDEWELVLRHGFVPVDLGARRLRSETAAVVLVAKLAR